MRRATLAVHPALREMVLSADAVRGLEDAVQLIAAPDTLWQDGWQPDPTVEILITGWGTPPLDDAALENMPRLAAVFHLGGSVRELLVGDVWSRGIAVVTAADANNDRVADFVAAQILLGAKGSFTAARRMREEHRLPGPTAGVGSRGVTVGLVSFGSIARKVRERLRPMQAEVIVWDPFVPSAVVEAYDARRVETLAELFSACTVISLHTPLIPGVTEGIIGAELLRLLPPNALFINTARGALVAEAGLMDTLRGRPDVFAVLDVTWPEPPVDGSALYELQNVMLTGHTAGAVGAEARWLGDLVVAEVAAFAAGAPLRHVVGRVEAERRA